MADDELQRKAPHLYEWMRERSLVLTPRSWRVFFDSASAETVDAASIEFTCGWSRAGMADPIRIGQRRESLDNIPITLTIRRGNPTLIDALKADNARRKEAAPQESHHRSEFAGLLEYWEPVDSRDGAVQDENGSLCGWFAVGPASFDFICAVATQTPLPNFSISLTVRLPTTELSWDGEGYLDVISGRIMLSADRDKQETDSASVQAVPDPATLQLSASKDIAASLERVRLTVIWVAVVFGGAIAIFR